MMTMIQYENKFPKNVLNFLTLLFTIVFLLLLNKLKWTVYY